MQDKPFDLHGAFVGQQKKLRVVLETGREVATHPGAKGDGTELHWKELLTAFLPGRYQVSKGFVVDSEGTRSDQIDLIVHDRQYSPLMWEDGGHDYVPAESVYAVFEVKQDLSPGHVRYAGKKAASVRRRKRTQGEFGWLNGKAKKELTPILAGLLTVGSTWHPALGEPFHAALSRLTTEEHLDLGCVLNDGSWDREVGADPHGAHLSKPETALITFCMHLAYRLQKLGTVGGIDYIAYENCARLTRNPEHRNSTPQ